MRFRKLRIAWSAGCLIACVMLIVLWVRSYFVGEEASFTNYTSLSFASGTIQITISSIATYPGDPDRWFYRGKPLEADKVFTWRTEPIGLGGGSISFPFWFGVVLITVPVAAPWLPWRYTLRTLLIATTLVAVVLGIIVWMSRTG